VGHDGEVSDKGKLQYAANVSRSLKSSGPDGK
jgi:hypothetical protein